MTNALLRPLPLSDRPTPSPRVDEPPPTVRDDVVLLSGTLQEEDVRDRHVELPELRVEPEETSVSHTTGRARTREHRERVGLGSRGSKVGVRCVHREDEPGAEGANVLLRTQRPRVLSPSLPTLESK